VHVALPEQPSGLALLPSRAGLSGARRRLFAAALTLYGERGYDAVSVRDLMAEIDLQPPALYAHVRSKQQLLFELITLGLEEHRDALKAALLEASSDPVDQIRKLVHAHVMIHCNYAAIARIIHREYKALNPEQMAAAELLRSAPEAMFRDVVERGIRLGTFRPDTDTFLAIYAIGAMGVRTADWWTPARGISPEHIADEYADYAIRLLT
jgi:AcrR family transcriptional regulator